MKESSLTDIIAGLITFTTMSYVVVVTPAILRHAGIPVNTSFVIICISVAISCIAIGIVAKSPIVVGPSMALTSYFATNLINHFNQDLSMALGAVLISGIIIIIGALFDIPQKIRSAFPAPLISATSAGIALLIAYVSINSSEIIVNSSLNIQNLVEFSFTIILAQILQYKKIRGNMLWSILIATIVFNYLSLHHTSITKTLEYSTSLKPLFAIGPIIKTLLNACVLAFLIMFDSTATIIALTSSNKKLITANFNLQKKQILTINGLATIFAGIFGCSNFGVYFESATGINAGGHSGLCAITVGVCFILCLFFSPYLKLIPTTVPGAILFLVSCNIFKQVKFIKWSDYQVAIPALLTIIVIPLLHNILDGMIAGLVCYFILNKHQYSMNKNIFYSLALIMFYLILHIYIY